jgi:hypothetical protein
MMSSGIDLEKIRNSPFTRLQKIKYLIKYFRERFVRSLRLAVVDNSSRQPSPSPL